MAKTKETEKLAEMSAENRQVIDATAAQKELEVQALESSLGAPVSAQEVLNNSNLPDINAEIDANVKQWQTEHPEAYNPYSDTWLPMGTDEKTLANMRRAHETDKLIAERYGMDGLRYTGDAIIGDVGSENWRNYNKMLGGANTLRAGLYNQDLVGKSIARYRKQQQEARDAELKAAQGAVDERNKADDVYTASNGTKYSIPKTFSDKAKQWLPYYTAAQGRIDAANAVLNNPNATAAQQKQAKAVLTAANNSMTKLVSQMNGYMEEAGLLGKSEVAPTTMEELQARWDADGDATMGSVAMEEVLSRALEREDEVYQEPQKSFEDIMEERRALDARQAEIDRDAEDRRIARQRLFTGIGDLSKIVGDMIKASDGALVTKSDVQQYYDNLTAQQRANYDNYRVRMQKLRDEAKAEQIRLQQNAFARAQADAARQNAAAIKGAELQYKRDKDEADRQLRRDIQQMKGDNALSISLSKPQPKGSGADLVLNGKKYHFKTGYDMSAFIDGLSGIIRDASNYPAGATVPSVNLEDTWDEVRKKQEIQNFVLSYFQSNEWNKAPKTVRDKILQFLEENSFRLEEGGSSPQVPAEAKSPQISSADSARIGAALQSLFVKK